MTERRLYLDDSAGERRGVVTLDGRPERLIIQRIDDLRNQALGVRLVARVRALDRAAGLAFLDVGGGPDAILNLTAETGRLIEGQAVEVEIRTEGRRGKGASARLIGPSEGPPAVLHEAPSLEEQLLGFARDAAEIRSGGVARAMADGAQDEALQTVFAIPGGGSIAVEPTRALIAVDVDLGDRGGLEAKRAARAANFAALGVAARVLRLKGLGGLVVVDLVGRGHDAPALISAARAAFGPDNPGVTMGAISRFGVLELTIPRRARPTIEVLGDELGKPSALTRALNLLRALEREAVADGGGRFVGVAAPDVTAAAVAALPLLTAKLGARLSLRAELPGDGSDFQISRA